MVRSLAPSTARARASAAEVYLSLHFSFFHLHVLLFALHSSSVLSFLHFGPFGLSLHLSFAHLHLFLFALHSSLVLNFLHGLSLHLSLSFAHLHVFLFALHSSSLLSFLHFGALDLHSSFFHLQPSASSLHESLLVLSSHDPPADVDWHCFCLYSQPAVFLHLPFSFFPQFYFTRACIFREPRPSSAAELVECAESGLRTWRANFFEDLKALVYIFTPVTRL